MFALYLFFAMLAFAILWLFAAVQRNQARAQLQHCIDALTEENDRLTATNAKLRARPPVQEVMHLISDLEPVAIYQLFERDREAPPHGRVIKTRYVTTDVDDALREKARLRCQLTVAEGFRAPNGDLFYNHRIRKVGE